MPGVAALQCARRLSNLRFGNLLLVRAACTVGFGMCGATSKTQTPQQAFDQVAEAKLRLFFQEGSGPNGGAGGRGCPTSHPGEKSITPALQWLTLNRTNVGGASAVCVLTAHRLALATPGVPLRIMYLHTNSTYKSYIYDYVMLWSRCRLAWWSRVYPAHQLAIGRLPPARFGRLT